MNDILINGHLTINNPGNKPILDINIYCAGNFILIG